MEDSSAGSDGTCSGDCNPWKEEKTIYEEETGFFHLRIAESMWGSSPARIMFLNNVPSTAETSTGEPVFEYALRARIAYGLVNAATALVIGVAGGTLVEDIKQYFPDAVVDGVEIDRRTIEAGKKYFSLEEDQRTNIIIDDGWHYIKTTSRRYDLVFMDAFNGNEVPPSFTTRRFFLSLKRRLTASSIVILNIISSVEGMNSKLFVRVRSSMSSVFRSVIAIPIWEDRFSSQNILFIASDMGLDSFSKKYDSIIYRNQ